MKYFKDEIMRFRCGDDVYREENINARKLYNLEYQKTRKKLPRKFIKIYEKHERFHDAKVPEISILTEYFYYVGGPRRSKPSRFKLIIGDYDDKELKWEVTLDNIKEISIQYLSRNPKGDIEEFIYDELLLEDDNFISWEMMFSSGFNIKIVFKTISIKELKER